MRYGRDEAPPTRRAGDAERRATHRESRRPVEGVLSLQRSAGNRTVTALLARAPRTAVPAGDKDTEVAGPRATLTGIGTIPLLSVTHAPTRRSGGSGREREDDDGPKQVVLTSRFGPHSGKLAKVAVDGKEMDVEIVIPHGESAVRLRLKGAIVSSYGISEDAEGPVETWSLDFSAMEHTVDRAPAGPGERGRERSRDLRGLERG